MCDDPLSSSSSSSNDNINNSSVCSQELIFNSDIFDLSIPSWRDSGKSNTIVLFPKALASAEAAAALAALEKAERRNKEVLAMPAQCRPLEWNSVPPLVDHRAMIAAVAMMQARAN